MAGLFLAKFYLSRMSLNLTDDKSTLVQVMAWCRQATSHYLNQCWPRSMSPYVVTRPQWVNSSWPSDTIRHHRSINIGSGNGLSPVQHQTITWTKGSLLSIGPLGTNFNEIWIEIQIFQCKKMHLKCLWKIMVIYPRLQCVNGTSSECVIQCCFAALLVVNYGISKTTVIEIT